VSADADADGDADAAGDADDNPDGDHDSAGDAADAAADDNPEGDHDSASDTEGGPTLPGQRSKPRAVTRTKGRSRRDIDTFEFTPPAFDRVRRYLHHLTEAGQGWINLLPGVTVEEEATVSPSPFAIFFNRQPPVTMCTLMPPRPARRSTDGVTIGVMHPTGGRAIARLKDAGVDLPGGWAVTQDHARRGLLVRAAHGTAEADIIGWAIASGTALCREPMTGDWQAVVYLP
jgi:hypothetical protein